MPRHNNAVIVRVRSVIKAVGRSRVLIRLLAPTIPAQGAGTLNASAKLGDTHRKFDLIFIYPEAEPPNRANELLRAYVFPDKRFGFRVSPNEIIAFCGREHQVSAIGG